MDRYQILGQYFGYPQCCIDAFAKQMSERKGWKDREPEVLKVIGPYNHGFVPCVDCARKILQGQATFESLIANRECSTPFPIDIATDTINHLAVTMARQN